MSRPAAPLLVLALIACHEFEGSAYTAECASMMPVIEWSSDDAGTSWVEYGLDEDYGNTTLETTEPTRDHQHFLIGMPPLSEVFFRTVTEVEGKERWTEGSLVTGGVPSDLPDFDVTVELPEDHDSDPYVLGTAFGGQPVVFVVDRRGNWLWYKRIEPDKNPIELAFEPGTGNVLFNSFLTDHGEDDSNVTRASFDCTVTEDIDTPQGHHAFTLVPDGGMAYVAIDVRDYDMDDGLGEMSVVGDAIWVIPPDGGEHELLWSTWDDWRPPEKTEGWDSSFYPQGADWTHANSLHYDEKRDTYLLSLRNFDMILEISGEGGDPVYEYGGATGYAFEAGSKTFEYQHDPDWTADGTLLMISTDDLARETTAVEYEVDHAAQLLRQVWSHGEGDGHHAAVQGAARDLPNGNRFVNYGSVGLIQEVTYEGEVVWEMSARMGSAFGNTVPFPDMYDPLGQ